MRSAIDGSDLVAQAADDMSGGPRVQDGVADRGAPHHVGELRTVEVLEDGIAGRVPSGGWCVARL